METEYIDWHSRDVRVQVEKSGAEKVRVTMKNEGGKDVVMYDSVHNPDWQWMEQVHKAICLTLMPMLAFQNNFQAF